MAEPQKDEHIEELLSKLQGIFGKLSHSEEEESKQKIEIPQPAPKESPRMETPPVRPPEAMSPIPTIVPPPPLPSVPPPPSVEKPAVSAPVKAMNPSDTGMGPSTYESQVPLGDPEKLLIPTAIYFPVGKVAEAKALAQRLEMMTPKFTKVAFRLRVIVFLTYDPKSDWKDGIYLKAEEAQFQTVFIVMDRPLDDARKKAIAAELEAKNIYFQDVLINAIEKKAFYTDILLGLVFFFDSRKPPAAPEGTNA